MPKRIDKNQPDITAALRSVGASVEFLHTLGQGVPDLLVGYRGCNYVLEVKDGSLPPSQKRLTPDEKDWHDKWRGKVHTVESVDEALTAIGALKAAPTASNEWCSHQPVSICRLKVGHPITECGVFLKMELFKPYA